MAENETKQEVNEAKVKEEVKEKAKEEPKKEQKKEEKKEEEIILKRNYTIPLTKAYEKPKTKRNSKAMSFIRSFIARNMKTDEEKVKIGTKVSELVNARGMRKPPKKIKVILSKNKEGIVKCELQ